MKKLPMLIVLFAGFFLLFACEKEDPVLNEEDQVQAEQLMDAGEDQIDGALKGAMCPDLIKLDAMPVPYYARMGAGVPKAIPLTNDGKFGIIYFYVNDPAGVIPPDFNLATFYDPRAFALPEEEWSTKGYGWCLPEYLGVCPYMMLLRGKGAVPLWVVTADQVDVLYADGVITLPEIQSLDPAPRKGYASRFFEYLRPDCGGNPNIGCTTFASGMMEDGSRFFFKYIVTSEEPGEPYNFDVEINFFRRWWW